MPSREPVQLTDLAPQCRRRPSSPLTVCRPETLPLQAAGHRFRSQSLGRGLAGLLFLALPLTAAAEDFSPSLMIKDHRFEPAELIVPANVKFKLIVKNKDPTPEEFESYELKREKVIRGNAELTLFLGPLAPGTYSFFGDFHQDSAQGRLIVR